MSDGIPVNLQQIGCIWCAHARSTSAGYDKLYNYAFLGPSGRIGTASDFVFAFVPHGPKKQLDLIFHAIGCHQQGLSQVRQSQREQCQRKDWHCTWDNRIIMNRKAPYECFKILSLAYYACILGVFVKITPCNSQLATILYEPCDRTVGATTSVETHPHGHTWRGTSKEWYMVYSYTLVLDIKYQNEGSLSRNFTIDDVELSLGWVFARNGLHHEVKTICKQ
jgi:hypothetical protein